MSTLYAYKNKLWKVKETFTYTGSPESFQLNPGKYLLICNGAHGGRCQRSITPANEGYNYGGTSYGVLNLTETKQLYAVVGGNGGDAGNVAADPPGTGGYNGGADGGLGYTSSYLNGAGGGGASDIRTSLDPQRCPIYEKKCLPSGYTRLDFIETDGVNNFDTSISFGLGHVDVDMVVTELPSADAKFGFNTTNSGNFIGVRSTGQFFKSETNSTAIATSRHLVSLVRSVISNNNSAEIIIDSSEILDDPGQVIIDNISSFIFNNSLKMKVYELVFYNENDDIEHYLIPCINSSNIIGMYDLITDEFVGDTNLIAGDIIPNDYIDIKTTTYVVYETIPDEYDQLEYIRSTGSSQCINTGIIPKLSYTTECRAIKEISWSIFGSGSKNYTITGVSSGNYGYIGGNKLNLPSSINNSIPHVWKIKNYRVYCDDLVDVGGSAGSSAPSVPLYIFCRNNGGIDDGGRHSVYYFKMFDEYDNLLMHLIPCRRKNDNVVGMWDVVKKQFFTNAGSGSFSAGPVVEKDLFPYTYQTEPITLLSRLIVAGGGGGQHNTNTGYNADGFRTWASMGGGIVGGPVMCNPSDSADFEKYASQTTGYSFGYGQVPAKAGSGDNNTEGRGGGGGGWFGGFAMQNNSGYTHNDGSGGGGSGYVLTESSYKPIGYLNGPELYLTDTFMSAGHAESASVIICEKASNIYSGDIIIVPPTGETCHFLIPSGQYILKCWGGMGGINKNTSYAVRGGYTQATLSIISGCEIYCNVGGSGIGDSLISSSYVHQFRPEINFNGGGAPGVYGTYARSNGKSGGGATDIRINSNSLYARVIVAGGSGGQGDAAYVAGVGGGTTGGSPSSGYGDNAGPGSQTETPHNTYSDQYPTIAGDFGYGGNAYNHSSGWAGGAGGGGWFGGNGTYPTRDGTKGGTGGSGYVLTASSYKPFGYLLNSDYYLTDTIMTSGGNNLHLGETKIEIEVVSATNSRILCRDSDGLKAFDENANRWIVISEEPTIETFQTYGSIYMSTDAGLQDEYEILVYDPENSFDKVGLTVSPKKQIVTHTIISQMTIARSNLIYEYDPDEYDVNMSFVRIPNGEHSQIVTTVELDKLDPYAVTTPKVYYAQYINRK